MTDFGHRRLCGILLHPTSLPGPYGIGTLGTQARAFVDFLHDAGQSIWQVLPLGPTGYGDSPYACLSTFAGNPLLIDLDDLVADGMLEPHELQHAPGSTGRTDYGAVVTHKLPLLREAAARFMTRASTERKRQFEEFCEQNRWWLEDFALFAAIKKAQGDRPISEWDSDVKARSAETIRRARAKLAVDLHAVRVEQFFFFHQWHELRAHARSKGVAILGDVPLFVAYDSADVWAHPELFKLDEDLSPRVVAGVPPDCFSATGQLWGNPVYDWRKHAESGYQWWLDRLKLALSLADVVRLDHFRGFEAAWEVPVGNPTAEIGEWVEGPGDAFFDAVRKQFGGLPLVAEDLGLITEEVYALRDRHALPGMHVLQFGFSLGGERIYAPHSCRPNSVAYTGTHDNDTTVGWFRTLSPEERDLVTAYLDTDGSEIHWTMIRAAYGTVAHTAIVPIQDVLGLASEARMNLPGSMGSSWSFRMISLPTAKIASELKRLAWLFERLPAAPPEPTNCPVDSASS